MKFTIQYQNHIYCYGRYNTIKEAKKAAQKKYEVDTFYGVDITTEDGTRLPGVWCYISTHLTEEEIDNDYDGQKLTCIIRPLGKNEIPHTE